MSHGRAFSSSPLLPCVVSRFSSCPVRQIAPPRHSVSAPLGHAPCPKIRTTSLQCVRAEEVAASDLPLEADISPTLRKGLSKGALLAFCAVCAAQATGYLSILPASVLLASTICFYSWTKQSLSTSGLISAWCVFVLTHFSSFLVSSQLLAFFISSSRWTEFKARAKDKITVENKKSGRRNWVQVMCNGGLPTFFAVLFGWSIAFRQAGISNPMSHLSTAGYACCCGDTWASEIGVLSKSEPRLITSLQTVPRGTNGGVSLLGLAASTFGGLLIGVTTYVMTLLSLNQAPYPHAMVRYLPFIVLGTMGGFLGSLVDSLLGATLQFSGFDSSLQKVVNQPGSKQNSSISRISGLDVLSNNQVNLLSSFIMALSIGALSILFFQ